MRVLVACECSGVVRRAFRALGHDAWSCDILPNEDGSPFHLQSDARDRSFSSYDLLIAHPPCTFLCNSGVLWLAPGGKLDAARHANMMRACDFFAALYHAPVGRVAVENPVMHGYARDYLASAWKVPAYTQKIQPHQFGDDASKGTGLWLRGLPPLVPTKRIAPRIVKGLPRWANQTDSGQNRLTPSPTRAAERAKTYAGIASAMAEQWGNLT